MEAQRSVCVAAIRKTECPLWVMCGRIWTPPDCNRLTGSGATVTTADVYPAGGAGLEHPSRSVTRLNKSVTVRTGGRAVSMENSRLRKAAPTSVNVTVGQRRRDYLTDREVERLIEAAKQNRSGHRD